jgi:benzodiazapine receptor
MPLAVLGLLFTLLAVVCFAFVLLHAFQRSVGTGFMVLCLPCYNVYYGFSQFEHARKGFILAGWLGGMGLGIALRVAAG